MERLTYRSPVGNAVSKGACSGIECDFDCDSCPIDTLVQHLCYYEDMIEDGKLVEQKHGRWVHDKPWLFGFECNRCGKWILPEGTNGDMNYCPNCGAKMDGDTNG